MSWGKVFDYFNARMAAVECTEIPESYDPEIPSSIIDRSYFQTLGQIVGESHTNQSIETTISHELRVHFKGFRDPRTAEREALDKAQTIVSACASTLNQTGDFKFIKGVYFDRMSLEPLSADQNDSIIVAILNFNVRIFICID